MGRRSWVVVGSALLILGGLASRAGAQRSPDEAILAPQ